MGKHRPQCGRVVDKNSLVGTGDDLSSIVSDFSTASGGEGINILATAARAAAVDVTEEEGKDLGISFRDRECSRVGLVANWITG
jgi:hypothetical protein